MKALSASIVVLSGAVVFSSGAFGHGNAQPFAQLVGCVVISAGLFGWWRELWIRDST